MNPTLALALERIAAREGCDVLELPPLYDTIDPEALTSLLESDTDLMVCFEYCGYRVLIDTNPLEVNILE